MDKKTDKAINAPMWSFIPSEADRQAARAEYTRLARVAPGVKLTLADILRSMISTSTDFRFDPEKGEASGSPEASKTDD